MEDYIALIFVALFGASFRYVHCSWSPEIQDLTFILPKKLYNTAAVNDDLQSKLWEELNRKVLDPSYEPYYKLGLLLDDNRLQVIYLYMASHKYYDIDYRYEKKRDIYGQRIYTRPIWICESMMLRSNTPRCRKAVSRKLCDWRNNMRIKVYMRQFPLPPLKEDAGNIRLACQDREIKPCIERIYRYISRSKTSLNFANFVFQTETPSKDDIIKPFWNYQAFFKFRTTVSYYMCWFTLYRDPLLKRIGWKTERCPDLRHDTLAYGKTLPPDNWRTENTDFNCAYYAFCPDVCCGMPLEAQHQGFDCRNINPCHDVGDSTCTVLNNENLHVPSLAMNKINYTCPCQQEREGFEWNPQFKMCVDIDECYQGNDHCWSETEMCVNTVGGFTCECKFGFKRIVGECRLDYEMRYVKTESFKDAGPKKPTEVTGNGFTLLDDLKLLWVILSRSPSLSPSVCTIGFPVIVSMMLNHCW